MASAHRGDFEECLNVFRSLGGKNTIVFTAVLRAADICREFEAGLALWAEQRRLGLQPNIATYTCAMTLQSRLGDFESAKKLWDELRSKGLEVDSAALTAILNAAASAGDVTATEALFEEALAMGWRVIDAHFGCLLKVFRGAGNVDGVKKVLADMRRRRVKANIVQYTTAMGVYNRVANPRADHVTLGRFAAEVCAVMSQEGVPPNSFFVEEHLTTLLGGAPFAKASRGAAPLRSTIASIPLHAVRAALVAIQDAEVARVTLRPWLCKVREGLLLDERVQHSAAEFDRPAGDVHAQELEAPSEVAMFNGHWLNRAEISGTRLFWTGGRVSEMTVSGPSSFSIHIDGRPYFARIDAEKRRLEWSDGDVWIVAEVP